MIVSTLTAPALLPCFFADQTGHPGLFLGDWDDPSLRREARNFENKLGPNRFLEFFAIFDRLDEGARLPMQLTPGSLSRKTSRWAGAVLRLGLPRVPSLVPRSPLPITRVATVIRTATVATPTAMAAITVMAMRQFPMTMTMRQPTAMGMGCPTTVIGAILATAIELGTAATAYLASVTEGIAPDTSARDMGERWVMAGTEADMPEPTSGVNCFSGKSR
jgi:hypothetical protein